MDPQQRLLLETTGEALLAAGALGATAGGGGSGLARIVAGSGVFVGITSTEYAQLAQVGCRKTQGRKWQLESAGRRMLTTGAAAFAPSTCQCMSQQQWTCIDDDHQPSPSHLQSHVRGFTPYSASGNLTVSVAPGRLSYTYGLTGPSLPVDTVCSSSLVR